MHIEDEGQGIWNLITFSVMCLEFLQSLVSAQNLSNNPP